MNMDNIHFRQRGYQGHSQEFTIGDIQRILGDGSPSKSSGKTPVRVCGGEDSRSRRQNVCGLRKNRRKNTKPINFIYCCQSITQWTNLLTTTGGIHPPHLATPLKVTFFALPRWLTRYGALGQFRDNRPFLD